ncbi:hypothetical protein SpCBS45565_g05600 [Spizellomyces sp. 'palustris']|nr:hypothetical protein SpCBS45565_g05600 [Spizellomyces sp. 'palustris']
MSADGHHHQKKVKASAEAVQRQREKNQKKIAEYRTLCAEVQQKRNDKSYDDEAFQLTTKLLSINPEYYTMWNLRRQILLEKFKIVGVEEKEALCSSELRFAQEGLKVNPKSYWVWNHRRWILENMPNPPWDRELRLLEAMLDLDARNFHGWNYRRYVVGRSNKRTPQEEFDFTTTKINQNFSNYSAWHHRSKFLPQAYMGEDLAKVIDDEFELVRNAIYTEPADQSAWLYQRWLLSLKADDENRWKNELQSIKELVDLEPESRWALVTLVHIMAKLQLQKDDALKILEKLEDLDPYRREYYVDLGKRIMNPTNQPRELRSPTFRTCAGQCGQHAPFMAATTRLQATSAHSSRLPVIAEATLLIGPACWATLALAFRSRLYESGSVALLCLIYRYPYVTPPSRTGCYRPDAEAGTVAGLILPPLVLAALILRLPDGIMFAYLLPFLRLSIWFSLLEALPILTQGWRKHWIMLWAVGFIVPTTRHSAVYFGVFGLATFRGTLHLVLTRFRRSFTFGEALVVTQTLSLLFLDALVSTVTKLHPTRVPQEMNIDRSETNVFMHALLFGMLLIGVLLVPLLRRIRAIRYHASHQQFVALSIGFYCATLAIVLFLIAPWTQLCLGAEPFTWVLNFILTPGTYRLALIGFWALIIAIGVMVAFQHFPTTTSDLAVLNLKRKYFHVLATLMFVPGYVLDPDFMHLAFSVALSALILLEYVRHYQVWPMGKEVNEFLSHFLDKRDRGPVILSHLYLLIGCALPGHNLAAVSGILTLGIGDTMASIHGKRFGRIRWPGTSKSVEGTMAFAITVTVACFLLASVDGVTVEGAKQWLSVLLCILLSSFLEAFSDQNDNLIIPLYSFALLHLFV